MDYVDFVQILDTSYDLMEKSTSFRLVNPLIFNDKVK